MEENEKPEPKNKPSYEEAKRFMRELEETGRKPKPLRYSPIAYVLGFIAGFLYQILTDSGWDFSWILALLLFIPPVFLTVFEKNHYKRVFKKKEKYNLED